MPAVRKVIISGAGIAGPALAYWLGRHNIGATVLERARQVRSGGYAIDLRGVALDVVERMGLLAEVQQRRTEMSRLSVVNAAGKPIVSISPPVSGPRAAELLRGDLIGLLHGAAIDSEFLFGNRITAVEQTADGVGVTLENGGMRQADLLVGADGLHSTTRALVFGAEESYSNFLGAYISIATVPNHLGADRETRLFNLPGRGVVIYHTPRADGAKAIFLLNGASQLGIDRRSAAQQQEFLKQTFAGAGWETDRLLAAVSKSEDFYFDSVTRIQMDRWSKGRVVLLGDAGYCPSPMSGQGTSLAVVGAYVLAEELARQPDVAAALAAYEQRMRPYVEANQRIADFGPGLLAPRSRLGITMRNLMLRAAPLLSRFGGLDTRLSRAAEALELDAPRMT